MPEEANPLPSLPLFPIQLRKYDIGELNYSCMGFSNPAIQPADKFKLNVSVFDFAEETRTIQLALEFSCGNEPPDSPIAYSYSLKMVLHAEFHINEDVERLKLGGAAGIKNWAQKNGVLVVMPFLREAVYSFTQKTGFKPMLIPLVETSAFKVMPPSSRVDPTPARAILAGKS